MTGRSDPSTLLGLLGKYGLATALAVFFVYWVTQDVSGGIRDLQKTLAEHIVENGYLLRQVCINTSQNDAQRSACLVSREH